MDIKDNGRKLTFVRYTYDSGFVILCVLLMVMQIPECESCNCSIKNCCEYMLGVVVLTVVRDTAPPPAGMCGEYLERVVALVGAVHRRDTGTVHVAALTQIRGLVVLRV